MWTDRSWQPHIDVKMRCMHVWGPKFVAAVAAFISCSNLRTVLFFYDDVKEVAPDTL